MKAKQKLYRFLCILLTCMMVLNSPMSVLAFEDVQILDVVEDAEIVTDEFSSDEIVFTDEEVVEEVQEQPEEQVLDNSAVELSLFEDESPELGESFEITSIEEVVMDTMELFSSGTNVFPFTVSVNGETVELEDGGVDESDNAQYCDAVPKKVIAKVPAGTTSVTIANETANMMIMDTPWHNFLDTGTKSYTAEVGADGAVYCVLTGDYYHLYIEVEEAEEEKLTDVNLIVPESLTAEADGVTYKYVTGERCTFSYETVPAGLETTQKWNLQDTNGNKLNWETPTMSWAFSGGEWTLELSVTYGEDTITKTIYLKEGGESGEGGETPDAPTTEIPFTVSVNGETVELEDGGVDESDNAQYCDTVPKKVIAKVPAGTTSVTIANEAANMMIMDTPWHNFLDTGTKSYTAEVGEDGAVYCIQVGDYYHLYIEVEEKEEVKLGSYISITTDMDGEVTVTEEETDMFCPVYKTVVPRGSGYAYFTFPANTIYIFEGSAKVTLRRTGHSPDKYYQAITNVDGSVTVKLLITDIYTGALDEETIACFWKPDGTSVLEGYAFEYSNDMSILLVGLAVGNGYTTNGATYVKNGEDYTFSIDVKNGYDATNMVVKVNGETVTPDENGIYTVEKVTEDLKITVEGVESIPVDGDVTVYFTMEDHDKLVKQGGTVWALEKVTIPYFDLAKYGMEYLYYNPNCYAGGGGQVGGTKETADGVVTLLHMMIWLTEVYYNGVDPEDAGQGQLAEELNWRGFSIHHATAGSAFFNIWDFGYNFNYYLNYEYPLGSPGWGSTCDQIKLSDNDVVTIRYNDNSGNVGTYHHFGENGIVEKSVKQGTNIDLNIYYTGVDNVNYTTPVYKVGEGHKVYMFSEYAVDADPTKGTYVGVTDTDGKVTVNTAELEVGRYYLVSDSMSPAVMLLEIQENTDPGAVELANAKTDAKAEITNYKNADNYREAEKAALIEVIEAARSAIDEAETIEEVTEIIAVAKAEMDAIKTDEQLKKEEAESEEKEAAETVTNAISSLPAVDSLTAGNAEEVKAAREAYEALTDAQKALVSTDTLKQLEAAEAKIAELTHVHSWDVGTVTKTATCKETGVKTFKCSCGETKTETIAKTASHQYGAWKTVSEATVKAAEVQKHICSVCGKEETKDVGKALTPVLEIPGKLSSFNMKKGKTEKFEVTMANGDSVSSVKSSKSKILKVTLDKKTGKITVKGVKKGTSKLTITLASGKTRTYTVKVVTGTVKTKGLTVTNVTDKKLTLAVKKSHTLKSELKPFTSTQKVTYKSSNKKIAKVTSGGKITAVAPGKATITAASGSKKVKITVTVPGIANVKSSVSVKKNKTLTLKPKAYGISEKVTYTSSNTKVATVTANGKIKGIKKGTAKITIQAGTFKKTVTVKVK